MSSTRSFLILSLAFCIIHCIKSFTISVRSIHPISLNTYPYPRHNSQPTRSKSYHTLQATTSVESPAASTQQKIPSSPPSPQCHPLGPPEPLSSLGLGEHLHFTRYDTHHQPRPVSVTRLSTAPDAFILRNFVSTAERYTIMWSATSRPGGMTHAGTVENVESVHRVQSSVEWVSPTNKRAGAVSAALSRACASILVSQDVMQSRGSGCEDMQTARYEEGGEFKMHHDGVPRVLTVIYYLNGVAGTWFPLATTTPEEEEICIQRTTSNMPWNKLDALEQIEGFRPGRNGLLVGDIGTTSLEEDQNDDHLVRVRPGDAVAFYNYCTTEEDDDTMPSPRIDWRAIHAGLPVTTSEKWIATHWFRAGEIARPQ